MALNQIAIFGRMTRDPEKRVTQSGPTVTSFTLACDRDYKPQGGEKETDFIDCVIFGKFADTVATYFFKGSAAIVTGRLQIRNWQDKDGNKRRSAEIVADNVYFGDSKRSESNDNQKENFNALSGRLSDDFVPALNDDTSGLPF